MTSPYSIYIPIGIRYLEYKTQVFHAYLDTGSSIYLCKPICYPAHYIQRLPEIVARDISENPIKMDQGIPCPNIWINGIVIKAPRFYTKSQMNQDILLGNNFIQLFQKYIQTRTYVQFYTLCGTKIHIPRIKNAYSRDNNPIIFRSKRGDNKEEIASSNSKHRTVLFIDNCKHIEFDECFSEHPLKFWHMAQPIAEIKTIPLDKPIRVKPMRYSPEDVFEFEKQIKELKELGLIRDSNSPHSSPAFMVRNHAELKRGKARMVINYKRLNDKTIFDGYFLPHKETLINQTRGKKIFSKFDCKSGYWQIKLTEDSIPYTAFSAPQGHYEWLVMPFGLKNAPQIFQRRMDGLFKPYNKFIMVYIDDILISSLNAKDHEKHLEIFKLKCLENGLALSQKKAELRKENIDFLGFKLDGQGIELQPHVLEKIQNFPNEITEVKQMQRFLGCLNYAEQFISKLAQQRAPLQKMLRKGNSIDPKETKRIITQIKANCEILPRLTLPSDNDNLILNTDALETLWGAVLKTTENKICRYTSGTFSDTESRYHSNEKELLAVIKGIKKFRFFLLPKRFIIQTDNTQVRAFILNNLPATPENKRLIRWQMFFSEYCFDI